MDSARTKTRIVGLTLAAAMAVLLVAGAVEAQPAPPPWVQLHVVQVRPDMVAEFMSVQKEFSERAKEAGTPFRAVLQAAQLGDTWKFLIATPMESLAELDATPEADAEFTTLVDRVLNCVVSRQSYAVRPIAEASKGLAAGETPKLMVTEFVRVAPGRGPEYLALLKSDILPHFDTANVPYITGQLGLGGRPGYIHFFYEDNFAEINKGSPVSRALGREGAEKANAKMAGIVTDLEIWVSRYLPEVSYDNRGASSSSQD